MTDFELKMDAAFWAADSVGSALDADPLLRGDTDHEETCNRIFAIRDCLQEFQNYWRRKDRGERGRQHTIFEIGRPIEAVEAAQ